MTVQMSSGLYIITDPHLPFPTLCEKIELSLQAGATLLQYRAKNCDAATQFKQAKTLAAICADFEIPLIINDHIELAQKVDAAGVHLGQGDDSIAKARAHLGSEAIIGITCHNDKSFAVEAAGAGADYISLGRFFSSQTKPDALGAKLSDIDAIIKCLTIPVVGIGGITVDNAAELINRGIRCLAVSGAILRAADPANITRAFCQLLAQAQQAPTTSPIGVT